VASPEPSIGSPFVAALYRPRRAQMARSAATGPYARLSRPRIIRVFDGPDVSADDPELAELKARWVESVRPIIARTPRWQRKSVQAQLLATMTCAGWSVDEARQIVESLFS
jgi:hypothetical protein